MLLLYIDPGTGSMLFSILIGVVSTLVFFGRRLAMRIRFVMDGGRAEKVSGAKIPYVIFSDHKRYWNVFRPICDEFERRGVDVAYWTASPDDPALSEPYAHVQAEFIGEGNRAYARLNMMNAGIVLSTTPGLDVYQWKRSRNADWYVHILHSVDDALGYRMFGLDFYDAVLLSGQFQLPFIRSLERRRNLRAKELVVVGSTYMDAMRLRLEGARADAGGVPTVLLAPSWGRSGILAKFGGRFIDALVATGYRVVVRPHPQSLASEKDVLAPLQKKYHDSELFSWNYDNDNFSVLNGADVLITDFSGIIFDYALVFDRPLIYADTSFDSAPYDAAWFTDTLWRFRVLPELGVRLEEADFPDLKRIIGDLLHDGRFRQGRERVRDEAWQNRGGAAMATVDYMLRKHDEVNNMNNGMAETVRAV